MMFWIWFGLILIVPSLAMMAVRHYRQEKHVDNDLTKLLDWPMVVTGILMMIPTWVWWDFIVGLIVVILWEGYKFAQVKRKHADHEYAQATAKQKETV